MIERMVVVTPKTTLDRSRFPEEKLESFVRVTGIEKTRRWNGTASQLACLAARELWGDLNQKGSASLYRCPNRCHPKPRTSWSLHGYGYP